jgi:hypothetical protein
MPIWGVTAILRNIVVAVLSRGEQRWIYVASFLMLILFVIGYARLSEPIIKFKLKRQKPEKASTMVESYRPRGIDR